MTLGSIIIVLVIIGLLLPVLGVQFDPRISRILTVILVVVLILWLIGFVPHQRVIF